MTQIVRAQRGGTAAILGLMIASASLLSCNKAATLTGPTVQPPSGQTAATVPLVVGMSTPRGWSNISVSVDGRTIGTITSPVAETTCDPIAGRQLVVSVTPGAHQVTAQSDGGLHWSESTTVPALAANQCWTVTLTCTAVDCGSQPSPPTPSQSYTLSGTVTDGTSGGILPNITIAVADGPNAGKSTRSDGGGAYTLSGLSAGTFTVSVSATSYQTITRQVTLGGSLRVDFVLPRSSPPPPVTPPPPAPPSAGTGNLSFASDANHGWSSIDVIVDGRSIGSLTAFVDPSAGASCAAGTARVTVPVSAGSSHNWSARSNTGATWSGTASVNAGGCSETRLHCTNRDCTPAAPSSPLPPVQSVGRSSNGAVSLTLRNDSRYTLQISLSGSSSKSVTLSPGAQQTLDLAQGGTFNENASAVNVPAGVTIKPLSGTVALAPGNAYLQTFDVS